MGHSRSISNVALKGSLFLNHRTVVDSHMRRIVDVVALGNKKILLVLSIQHRYLLIYLYHVGKRRPAQLLPQTLNLFIYYFGVRFLNP
jgi:hypothetical protein